MPLTPSILIKISFSLAPFGKLVPTYILVPLISKYPNDNAPLDKSPFFNNSNCPVVGLYFILPSELIFISLSTLRLLIFPFVVFNSFDINLLKYPYKNLLSFVPIEESLPSP